MAATASLWFKSQQLLALACKKDLEGVVAKYRFGPYLQDRAQWFKIRNRRYSQWAGREKFFESITYRSAAFLACAALPLPQRMGPLRTLRDALLSV